MFAILDLTKENLIAFQVKGKIEKSDYEKLNPLVKKTEEKYGNLKLYIEIQDVDGIGLSALWEDIKFYFRFVKELKKIAITCNSEITEILSKWSKPFVSSEIQFFDFSEKDNALKWINEN